MKFQEFEKYIFEKMKFQEFEKYIFKKKRKSNTFLIWGILKGASPPLRLFIEKNISNEGNMIRWVFSIWNNICILFVNYIIKM